MDNTNITVEQNEALVAFLAQTSQAERSSEQHIKKTDTSVSTTQTVDSIAAAAASVQSGASIPSLGKDDIKLEAPKLSSESQLQDLSQPESTNAMAIIEWAMTLVALANSLNFNDFYKIANKSKEYAAEMAPVEGQAITAAGNAQSAATKTDANQSLITGITSLAVGVVTFGSGAVSGLGALAEEEPLKSKTPLLNDEAKKAEDAAKTPGKATSDVENQVKNATQPKPGVKSTLSRIKQKFSEAGLASSAKLLDSVFKYQMSAQTITQSVTGISGAKNSSAKAEQEKIAGEQNATKTIVEQGDIQYSNQTTQQYQSNYNSSNQNVDSADNNWLSAIQAITQANNTLFRV